MLASHRKARDEGYKAHAEHKTRLDNPYVKLAYEWDYGWVQRQKVQLHQSGKSDLAARVQNFSRFFKEHLR